LLIFDHPRKTSTATRRSSWLITAMSKHLTMSNQQSSLSPANGHRQTVGDGATAFAAVKDVFAGYTQQTKANPHYYNTTFSGGDGWRF